MKLIPVSQSFSSLSAEAQALVIRNYRHDRMLYLAEFNKTPIKTQPKFSIGSKKKSKPKASKQMNDLAALLGVSVKDVRKLK